MGKRKAVSHTPNIHAMKWAAHSCIPEERIWPQGMNRYPTHLDMEIT